MSIHYVSLAANSISKPPETAGRKAMGAKVLWCYASPAANLISKPLETVGRKAMGAKVLRYYASPAAGNFASVIWQREEYFMSKKKTVESRKRTTALFKSAVVAGAAISGVDVFSNAGVVYAAELE